MRNFQSQNKFRKISNSFQSLMFFVYKSLVGEAFRPQNFVFKSFQKRFITVEDVRS